MDVKQRSTQQPVLHHYGSVGDGVEHLGVYMNIIIIIVVVVVVVVIVVQPQAFFFLFFFSFSANFSATSSCWFCLLTFLQHQAAGFLC